MTRLTARHFLAACFGLVLAGACAWSARATDMPAPKAAQAFDLTYEVYLGGLHIFSFAAAVTLRTDGYSVAVEGGTRGLIGWLYKWDIKLAAEGADRDGAIRPRSYVNVADWQSKPRTTRLAFAGQGAYAVTRDPPEDSDSSDDADDGGLPGALPDNIVDPLSFAIAASRALAATGRCAQTQPVFDGKRRYDMVVKDLGADTLAPSDYSIYRGPAICCGLAMERISGFSKKRRAVHQWDDDKTAPPTVWLATIRDGLPPLPVRYEGAIGLGDMVVHLAKVDVRSEVAEAP